MIILMRALSVVTDRISLTESQKAGSVLNIRGVHNFTSCTLESIPIVSTVYYILFVNTVPTNNLKL